MNRMNGRVTGNPTELGVDFEPSCLVRTPSGNVYIPSGNLGKTIPFRHDDDDDDSDATIPSPSAEIG